MELNNIKTYLAIGIIGGMVGILYLIIQRELSMTLLFFYITLYIITTLRYLLERRHYRKHKAVTASTQFLLLPFSIMLMGNYISPVANFAEIFIINVDSAGGDTVRLYFNLISITMIVPVAVLTFLFNKYFSGKWPAMAINRKIRRGKVIPFLLFTLFVLLLLLGFFISLRTDFLSLIFALIYISMVLGYFIVSPLQKARQPAVQRAPTTSSRRTPSRTAASASSKRSSSSSTTTRRTTRSTVSASSASRRRAATTVRSTSAKIAPGKDISTTKKTTRSTTVRRHTKNIFPVGKATKEDLKCIICYMDFKKSESRKVILCPHCKYPAHADEFFSWFQQSKLCARCNKPISTKYVKSPIYRVSTKVYIESVIEKL